MIVGPAEAADLSISPRLVQRILTDAGTGPGALALARSRWPNSTIRGKAGNALTEADYEAIGRVGGVIDRLADEVVKKV